MELDIIVLLHEIEQQRCSMYRVDEKYATNAKFKIFLKAF